MAVSNSCLDSTIRTLKLAVEDQAGESALCIGISQ